MTGTQRIIGIIPARSGSKGIPGKNTKELQGKPLIAYTINAAQQSKHLTRTIVSTDSSEIAELAKSLGVDVPFLRPKELATDEATAMEVMQHALAWLKKQGEEYDYVAYLQPTSPLRTAEDIDACIAMAMKHNADSVFSLRQMTDFAPEKLKTLEDGKIKPLLAPENKESGARQKGPDVYKRNCAVYLTRSSLIENGDLFGNASYGYVMPEERSVDINTPTDFALAEFWMQHHD